MTVSAVAPLTPNRLVRLLADQAPMMVWMADASGGLVYANSAWLMFRGVPLDDELGTGWLHGIHENDRDASAQAFRNAVEGGFACAIEFRARRADGVYRWIAMNGLPQTGRNARFAGLAGSFVDTTQQHDATFRENQRQIRESEDQLRLLAARLQTAREEERARLSRELHDELGQTLTALKLEIGRAIAALQTDRLNRTSVDRLQTIMGLSEIGLAMVKRIATDLRPAALDHLGLFEAIRWEALTFKARSGLRCHVRANKKSTELTAEQQTALFRIFQEALTNIVRHARASAVTVTLTERAGRFELCIRDNGRGITEAEAADPRAIGLVGMRERAALVGGVFGIAGRRGRGTTVSVKIPVTRSRHAAGRRPRKVGGHSSR